MQTKIESSSNSTFKKFQSLTTSKGLKTEELFILCGEKLIREFLENPNLKIHSEVIPIGGEAKSPTENVFELAPPLFKELDVLGTNFNLLILHQPKIGIFASSDEPQGLEVICPLGDPSNLGAIIRSAEAFGVSKMILTEEAAHPFLPKAVKAAAGSVLRLPLYRTGRLKELSSAAGLDIIALNQGGVKLNEFKWPKDCRLLVGEEGPGLKGLNFKQILSIQTLGVESLNAVVAASLAFYEYSRKK